MNGGRYNWRQDGKVAEVAAKALHNDDVEKRSVQLVEWANEARRIIQTHEAGMKRIYMALHYRQMLDGDALTKLVQIAVRVNAAA